MSDTPRTDAKEKETLPFDDFDGAARHAHYGWKWARRLETKLVAARHKLRGRETTIETLRAFIDEVNTHEQ